MRERLTQRRVRLTQRTASVQAEPEKRVRLTQRMAKVEPNPMDGLKKRNVSKAINKMLYPLTKGIFRDEDWRNVRRIWKALDDAGLDWHMTDNEYLHNDQGQASGKQWKFEVHFINERGRETTLYGIVTASGAGSVDDPLESYDLVAYVS